MTAPVAPDSSRLRLTVLLIVVGCLFVALLARLWYLQVINVTAARQAVTNSGQVVVLQPAARGEILDREGQVLVGNHNVAVIEALRSDGGNITLMTRLAAVAGMTLEEMEIAVGNEQYTPLEPVPVLQNASAQQILYVDDNPSLFPGVTATTLSEPYVTTLGEYAGNLLGYVGPIPSSEVKSYLKRGYQPTDIVGIGGVEQQFENQLRGKPGRIVDQVNARGQLLSRVSYTPAVPGHNIRLTLNGKLQKQAVLAMQQGEASARGAFDKVTRRNFTAPAGSVVAEDPRNGQVLALATNPGYDPNLFDGGISEANYAKLAPCASVDQKDTSAVDACELAHPADPLLNRPIQGEYAPGSTFKLTTATAGLEYPQYTGVTPTSTYDDIGYLTIGGKKFTDDNGQGAGIIDLTEAITRSSDNYFNEIGVDLWDARSHVGETALQKVEEQYGFGRRSGINLPGEYPGVVPTPALYAAQYKAAPKAFPGGPGWYTGDSAITAIGQGEVLVTPLQLADAYAAFANGGTLYVPQVALDAETSSGKKVVSYAPKVGGHSPSITAAGRAAMLAGFVGVVNDPTGTAYSDFATTPLAKDDIAGKTGTAQVTGAGKQNTSVFTSFAPANSPRIVIDCFMEDAGYGASLAAPIVRSLYERDYGNKVAPVTYTGDLSGQQN